MERQNESVTQEPDQWTRRQDIWIDMVRQYGMLGSEFMNYVYTRDAFGNEMYDQEELDRRRESFAEDIIYSLGADPQQRINAISLMLLAAETRALNAIEANTKSNMDIKDEKPRAGRCIK